MTEERSSNRRGVLTAGAAVAAALILALVAWSYSGAHVQALSPWVLSTKLATAAAACVSASGAACSRQLAQQRGEIQHQQQQAQQEAASNQRLQHPNHIYSWKPADPYGCDFSRISGAWTGTLPAGAATPGGGSGKAGSSSGGSANGGTGGTLFGTAAAQAAIWAHQHPRNCKNQRFLLTTPQRSGIGSQIHVLGLVLAVAMDLDRILLLDTDVHDALFTDDAYCGPARPNLDDCYFQRLSSCTLADTGLDAGQRRNGTLLNLRTPQHQHKVLVDKNGKNAWKGGSQKRVPKMLAPLLQASPVRQHARHYWWRAQAAAYLVRPNMRTLQALAELRRRTLQGGPPSGFGRSVSVHVRHGDKWREAKETPTLTYFQRAQQLQEEAGAQLDRRVFLSTEDPAAVAWFAENATGWDVAYTDSVRKPDPGKSTRAYARERGPAAEYLDSLLNLELALECGAWVGTLTSNWCRLIDELRSTMRCKADGTYLDAAQHHPPQNLGWR